MNHTFHSVEDAIKDLQKGKVVIVVDDEDRENEGDFVCLSEKITPDIVNFMITYGKGLVCTTITSELAKKLHLSPMVTENTDPLETAFTVSIDHVQTTTGISAYERALTIKKLTDPEVSMEEFKRPGHVFPLIAKNGGVFERVGHTEASVDLARLANAFPSAVICEVIKEDGTMARVPDLFKIASIFNLKMITIQDIIAYRKQKERKVVREVETVLATEYGEFTVYGYSNQVDNKEHIVLLKGDISKEPVLLRIHSECLTGDVFSSYRCDCGPQLDKALRIIQERKSGMLIYMRQEGRGIGLLNKLKAYQLQDQGFDTVEANHQLGFSADLREYGLCADILKEIGIAEVELMTNNPKKVEGIEQHGIHVTKRVPIQIQPRFENKHYLRTKQEKLGHLLSW